MKKKFVYNHNKKREAFLETDRILISLWERDDEFNAYSLFGDPTIGSYFSCGVFTYEEINRIVSTESSSYDILGFCLFPVFAKENGAFVGLCGLRLFNEEMQFAIVFLPDYWHKGYGVEASELIINYAFDVIKAPSLLAARCDDDEFCKSIYEKMGFKEIRNCFRSPNEKPYHAYLLYSKDYKKNQGV